MLKKRDVKIDQELSRLSCAYAEKLILRSSSAHDLKAKFRATPVQGKMFSERTLPSRKIPAERIVRLESNRLGT